ncbi:MAG: GNAT family N-acetyltransferase [Rikenellaceae bacterium]|nr:GNAT family N-acetyltransferase [Rikenellaceae bacterium]
MATEPQIFIRPLRDEDFPLFCRWLDKEYIYTRFCPNGEHERKAWLDEVADKEGKYGYITHFIIYYGERKIGYCFYADSFFIRVFEEGEYTAEMQYEDFTEPNHTYEIGYLIGEEEFLNRGICKTVIGLLEDKIRELGGREIAADPSEENIFSVKALLSRGFTKKGDEDYRKIIPKL